MGTSLYELLASLSAQMRQVAERGDWDQFLSLEQQFNSGVTRIKPYDKQIDEIERQCSIELIRQILANNVATSHQMHNRIAQLEGIMQSNVQEQKLNRAYYGTK